MKKNENKVTEAFTELMIKKLQTIQADWKQPWVNIGFTGMPRNINGRHYNGMNSLMLMMLREEQGYQTPVFMTFRQAKANGWDVKKGEKGFPVELWRQIYKDENGKKISYEEFSNLSESEQQKCTSYPVNMTYIVFNAQQTRMPEVAPEKYQENFFRHLSLIRILQKYIRMGQMPSYMFKREICCVWTAAADLVSEFRIQAVFLS